MADDAPASTEDLGPDVGLPTLPDVDVDGIVDDIAARIAAAIEEGAGAAPVSSTTRFNISSSEVGVFNEELSTNIQRIIDTFIDIQTPEEFLDDFEVGYATYLGGLRTAGVLSQSDMGLAQREMGNFMLEYIGELGAMAVAGEDMFDVVGIEGDPEFIGSRVLPGVETKVEGEEQRTGTQKSDTKTAQTVSTDAGTGTQTSAGTEETKVDQKTTTASETVEGGEERIFTRPKLGVVSKLSPLAFLESKFSSPGELATVVRGRGQTLSVRGAAISTRRA